MASVNGFINRNSFMHRLNPSIKFLGFIFLIIMIFLPLGFFGQLILLTIILLLWVMSKLPRRIMWSIIKSVFVMTLILFLINWITFKDPSYVFGLQDRANPIFGDWNFFKNICPTNTCFFRFNGIEYEEAATYANGDIVCTWGWLWGGNIDLPLIQDIKPIDGQFISYKLDNGQYIIMNYTTTWYALSSETLVYSFYVSIKIYLMIVTVTLLTTTTTSVQLTFAIEDILNPLKIFRIPVNEWAMTIAIAIRFVPSLLDESQRILKAQSSRGMDFSNGSIKDKTKSLVSLVIPMFSIAFKKADDLANAMEARSYNPRYARTRYRSFLVHWYDWILFAFLATIMGLTIAFVMYNILFVCFGPLEAILIFG